MSSEDKLFLDILDKETVCEGKRYIMYLPFKDNHNVKPCLPDNSKVVCDSVHSNFYVDDGLCSASTEEEAIYLIP